VQRLDGRGRHKKWSKSSHNTEKETIQMFKHATFAFALATAAALAAGACTTASNSGALSSGSPAAYTESQTVGTDAYAASPATVDGPTMAGQPEPGYNPDRGPQAFQAP
jgi:hypothetical protein